MKALPLRSLLRKRKHLFTLLDECLLYPRHWRMPHMFATSGRASLLTDLALRYQQQRRGVSMLYVACHHVTSWTGFLQAIVRAAGLPAVGKQTVEYAARWACEHVGATMLLLDGFSPQLVKAGSSRSSLFAALTNLMEASKIPFFCTGTGESVYLCFTDEGVNSRFPRCLNF